MSNQCDVCLVFADVSGSTTLYEKLGDAEALRAVARCVQEMERATAINKGRVVKTIGDEVMALFDSAAQGMQAASEMQQRIDNLPPLGPGVKLSIRAGLHFGPAIVDNGDVFGDTVNTAARMAGFAKAGQIITTADTVAALPELLRSSCREIDALAVKGKADCVRVCEVLWQEGAELTMMSGHAVPVTAPDPKLRLQYGGNEIVVDAERPKVTLGRDLGCDLVVGDPRASRTHARIERRRDKFVLADISSNGTYVTFGSEPELALKREEVILRGRGLVVFGHAGSAHEPGVALRFAVED